MIESAKERDAQNRAFEAEVRKFGEIVLTDDSIMQKLEATRDANDFINTYCSLAAEKGIHFTQDDMRIVVQEQKTGSNWILPKPVLQLAREIL